MEEKKEIDLEDIFLDAKAYIDIRVEHAKLSAVEKGAKIFADLITNGAVFICFILAFLFASFTLALYLSEVLGSNVKGFACVAAIYLLLSVIVYLTKEKYIEKLLVNLFIRKYFDKVADKDDEDEEKLY